MEDKNVDTLQVFQGIFFWHFLPKKGHYHCSPSINIECKVHHAVTLPLQIGSTPSLCFSELASYAYDEDYYKLYHPDATISVFPSTECEAPRDIRYSSLSVPR